MWREGYALLPNGALQPGDQKRTLYRRGRRVHKVNTREDQFDFFRDPCVLCGEPSMVVHSWRRATSGSTRAARRAGMAQAAKATTINNSVTAANVNGSLGAIP